SGVIGEFETAFARFVGAPHAVSFASGTSAIHAMSRIAGLRLGEAIIAPAYTFFATATPFGYDGIEVVFADADRYGNVTAATLAEKLTPAVRAVIVTHMWGNPCPMGEIVEFCRAHELLLMEDCSHAHFASWRGERVGNFGDMAVFSTNQKAITTGEGGVLVTANDRYRELALLYGHYNKRCQKEINPGAEYYPYAFTGMGLKHRITTLGAAIGLHQLDHAADIETRRRAILARYTTGLAGNPVITPAVVPDVDRRHGLYVLGLRFHPGALTPPGSVSGTTWWTCGRWERCWVAALLGGSALTDMTVAVPDGHYTDESMSITVVPNRNAVMLNVAVAVAVVEHADAVAFGAHADDHAVYPGLPPGVRRSRAELRSGR
ncbi:MAG: aminotransferase class I/II-fold pyridoxal phosphate-dependent enzyme, partial [Pseudonocardiaceae bacterium]